MRVITRVLALVIIIFAALYYLQFGAQALAHHFLQGALSLLGAAGLFRAAFLKLQSRPASPIVLFSTLPVFVFHIIATIQDPGELPFLIGSTPAPLTAAMILIFQRIATLKRVTGRPAA